MEKKRYNKPISETINIEVANLIAASTRSVNGNAFGGTARGGNGPARARSRRDTWSSGWDD